MPEVRGGLFYPMEIVVATTRLLKAVLLCFPYAPLLYIGIEPPSRGSRHNGRARALIEFAHLGQGKAHEGVAVVPPAVRPGGRTGGEPESRTKIRQSRVEKSLPNLEQLVLGPQVMGIEPYILNIVSTSLWISCR